MATKRKNIKSNRPNIRKKTRNGKTVSIYGRAPGSGKKIGRPNLIQIPTTRFIGCRVTPAERDHLEYWSWRYDWTISEYIRLLIEKDINARPKTRRMIKEAWLKNPENFKSDNAALEGYTEEIPEEDIKLWEDEELEDGGTPSESENFSENKGN